MNLLCDFFFTNLTTERNIDLILDFCNFRPERYDLIAQFFNHFHQSTFSASFGNFDAIYVSKEWIYFPILNYFLGVLRQGRSEFITQFLAIFLNLRPGRSAFIARFWPIATNFQESRNCCAQASSSKGYTVTETTTIPSFKLRTGIERKILYFWRDQLEGSRGLLSKMTLQQTNTADLQLHQHTGEPNLPWNQLVSGRFSGESMIEYLSSNSNSNSESLSHLAAEFTKREYLRHYCWSVYFLFLGV